MRHLFTRKAAGAIALIAGLLAGNANATPIPLINSVIPDLIIESCLDKTDAALDSPQFIDCLTNTLTREPGGDNIHRSDPTHRPSTANHVTNTPDRLDGSNVVICASDDASYTKCTVSNANRNYVQLLRQTSTALCKLNESWGVVPSAIWTDKGCAGIFYVGNKPYVRKTENTITASSSSVKKYITPTIPRGVVTPIPKLPEFTKDGWRKCALEFQVCKLPFATKVRFGRPGAFYERSAEGNVHCRTSTFGDPAPSSKKACYYKPKQDRSSPQAAPPTQVVTQDLPPLKNSQIAPNDDLFLNVAEPLWKARGACSKLGSKIIASKNSLNERPLLYLGLGTFENQQLNQKPVLVRTGDKLAGRGVYQHHGLYVPFNFSCALNRSGRTAQHFVFHEQNSDLITQDLLPNPDTFSKEAASQDGVDGSYVWAAGLPVGEQDDKAAVLVHGVPKTDDIDFYARCLTGSGNIEIMFQKTVPNLQQGDSLLISLATSRFTESYVGLGSALEPETGVPLPLLKLSNDASLWNRLTHDNTLKVNLGGYGIYNISLKGSAKAVPDFVRACGNTR
ncbi:hypothetical protein PsAD2_00663 [Pseudovibrio axinellae]|uniref:Uncharacterized protein n=2 Tax=Pseudovibrio axinellae TaxID=989403 RepID=A0A166AP58_9HYPH|nr:hypothetical protein PsAD2_00663 [Pseudovibrio axinellae]SEQ97823.1 Protein of unknown function [Pseudovibrio axinellae]